MRTFLSTLLAALLLAVSVQSFGVYTPVLSAAQSQVRCRFVDGKEMLRGIGRSPSLALGPSKRLFCFGWPLSIGHR
jgi:hypothetical protein